MNQDEAFLLVCEQDMKKRISGGQRFVEFLASTDGDLSQWNNVGSIISSVTVFWVNSSNFKVVLLGLDILSLLVERLQTNFQVHYIVVENALVDRLGDQKDQVQDAVITLFLHIMDAAASPQYLFDRMTSAFNHNAWRVREAVCRLLVATLKQFGAKSLVLSKILPHLCKLVTDPNEKTRDAAMSTIVEMYRHVGEKIRLDLARKGLPSSRLQALYDKFDDLVQSGDVAAALKTGSLASSPGSFESGYSSSSVGMLPLPARSTIVNTSTSSVADGSSGTLSSQPRSSVLPPKSTTSAGIRANTGAVDEESFIRDFDQNLPPVRICGARDVDEQMTRIQAILSDEKKDWEERTKALKALRAVVLAGGRDYDLFYQRLRLMGPALQLNAKDLRSQVVRETAITIGYLSSILKNQFDHTASCLMSSLFSLVSNAAKVMSTSGILAIRTVLKHTHSSRLISVVINYCTSRSTSTRRQSFASLVVIFQHWPAHLLEKHMPLLAESVQKGLNDADSEAREESRKAWRGLYQHSPTEADRVFSGLNASQQKLIKGDLPTNSSIETLPSDPLRKKSHPSVATTGVGPRRFVARAPPSAGLLPPGTTNNRFLRSRSDIDPASARRSQMKAMASGRSPLGRAGWMGPRSSASSNLAPTDRGRVTKRSTTSQPGSRSGSPGSSSRGLLHATGGARTSTCGGPGRNSTADFDPVFTSWDHDKPPRTPHSSPTRTSRIPVSTSRNASRAGSRLGSRAGSQLGSPTGSRSGSPPRYRGQSSSSLQSVPPMRVLPKGREGEIALTDALLRKLNTRDARASSDDDTSDVSSVYSGRSSNHVARDGMQCHRGVTDDVAAILQLCQSASWAERKEGLASLHGLIVERKDFDAPQLKKMLEIFNRMFADPHGKVFSLFIEILPDFINNYHEQTEEWLYVLLTQLLKKLGSDLLGSVQAKTLKALQIARDTYPSGLQFNVMSRYIIDQTQRPNLKVKVALLRFLLELVSSMEPSEVINTSDTRLALSRIISWTTEPKSHDVRKFAEMVVMAIFELNASCFTMMIRVLPKTFQDGAMKVLQGYRNPQDPTPSAPAPTERRVSDAPIVKISPVESVEPLTVSLRGSLNGDKIMDRDEIAENFRNITAGIHNLRMDSSVDDDNLVEGDPSRLEDLCNRNVFSEHLPSRVGQPAGLDETFNEELSSDQHGGVADIAFAFLGGKDKKRAINDLIAVLRRGDVIGELGAPQQQWDEHFTNILSGVLGALSTGKVEQRVQALRALKVILRHLPHLFANHAEMAVIHVLQAHADQSEEVAIAAEECGEAFCYVLPPVSTVLVLSPHTRGGNSSAVQACLKLLTNAISRSSAEELTNQIVSNLVPGLLQCYDDVSSGVRKAAVFCLVALHRVIGDERLCQHLTGLSDGKMKLLQLYIKRSQTTLDDPGEA